MQLGVFVCDGYWSSFDSQISAGLMRNISSAALPSEMTSGIRRSVVERPREGKGAGESKTELVVHEEDCEEHSTFESLACDTLAG